VTGAYDGCHGGGAGLRDGPAGRLGEDGDCVDHLLSLKIQEIREATDYQVPIQLKLGAARVYDDVRMAAKCGPDIIYLDGAEGGTWAGPHIGTEETGIPRIGGCCTDDTPFITRPDA
jgi:hypothetical protein